MLQIKIKKYFLIFLLLELVFSYSPALADTPNYAQGGENSPQNQIEKYLCAPTPVPAAQTNTVGSGTGNSIQYNNAGTSNANQNDLYNCINRLYKFAIILAVTIGVFFIVIAGFIYMSAEGNAESVDKAKNILVTTITSLVILLAGYLLLHTINPDITQFQTIQPCSVVDCTLTTVGAPATGGSVTAGAAAGPPVAFQNYNIGKYDATEPAQAQAVISIYNKLSGVDLSTADKITQYMNSNAKGQNGSPLTGQMVLNSASQYNVDPKLIMAIMEIESNYGSAGLAVSTQNPGNVGNFTGVKTTNMGGWQAGVDAVAKWLNNNRVA